MSHIPERNVQFFAINLAEARRRAREASYVQYFSISGSGGGCTALHAEITLSSWKSINDAVPTGRPFVEMDNSFPS
jgi:hypothetical protein